MAMRVILIVKFLIYFWVVCIMLHLSYLNSLLHISYQFLMSEAPRPSPHAQLNTAELNKMLDSYIDKKYLTSVGGAKTLKCEHWRNDIWINNGKNFLVSSFNITSPSIPLKSYRDPTKEDWELIKKYTDISFSTTIVSSKQFEYPAGDFTTIDKSIDIEYGIDTINTYLPADGSSADELKITQVFTYLFTAIRPQAPGAALSACFYNRVYQHMSTSSITVLELLAEQLHRAGIWQNG
jgi:hypothetical protein